MILKYIEVFSMVTSVVAFVLFLLDLSSFIKIREYTRRGITAIALICLGGSVIILALQYSLVPSKRYINTCNIIMGDISWKLQQANVNLTSCKTVQMDIRDYISGNRMLIEEQTLYNFLRGSIERHSEQNTFDSFDLQGLRSELTLIKKHKFLLAQLTSLYEVDYPQLVKAFDRYYMELLTASPDSLHSPHFFYNQEKAYRSLLARTNVLYYKFIIILQNMPEETRNLFNRDFAEQLNNLPDVLSKPEAEIRRLIQSETTFYK